MKFVPKELKETADISRGDQSWRRAIITGCKYVVVLLVAYLLLGLCADFVATTISEKWEARLLAPTHTFFVGDAESGEIAADIAQARAIFARLTEAPGLRALPYRLEVADTPDPNAFAFGGGLVVVTQGLLDEVEGEIGIALVLAHELGHHQHRHVLKRLGRSLLLQCALALVFGSGSDAQDSVTGATVELSESGYSRAQETEADDFGLRLVHETFGHSDGALEFFEKIHANHESAADRWLSFFSTHPATTDRIERLRTLQRQLGP
jgi:Zn-dependent protease with chaperone function